MVFDMKYKEAYEYGCDILIENGIQEAKLDARLLLEFVCDTNRNDLLVHGDRDITQMQMERYVDKVAKRAQHFPLQYIIGQQEFMGLDFHVNSNVLIPRQDTECLVEEALTFAEDGMAVLDMCTGSGCILLSIMNYKNDIHGVGVDVSKEAIELASENAKQLNLDPVFYVGNMFQALHHRKDEEKRFDLIVSNPPYIKTDVIESLMEEVKNFEPYIALDGKEDGLYFYKILAEEATDYLNPGGRIYLEIGFDQGEEVSALLRNYGYSDITIARDLAGLCRVVYGRKGIHVI